MSNYGSQGCKCSNNKFETVQSFGIPQWIQGCNTQRVNPGGLNFYAFAYQAQRVDGDNYVGVGGDMWRYYINNGRLPYGPR